MLQYRIVKGLFMSYSPTRREFLGDAAKAGAASALKLDISPLPKSVAAAHPERKANFDSQWRFFKGDTEGAQAANLKDASWRILDLPHDWSIEGPFREDARPPGTELICPPALPGTESSLRSRPQREANVSLCSSTGSTSEARFGSMERPWECGRMGSVPFPMI